MVYTSKVIAQLSVRKTANEPNMNLTSVIKKTFLELVALDAPSGKEEQVATYIMRRLKTLGLTPFKDPKGNVLCEVPGTGEMLLLNAHMDRVLPGVGIKPVIDGDTIRTDHTTNLGADDAAGIAIILEAVEYIIKNNLPHPPLLLVFTVEEEKGLIGASATDLSCYPVTYGITLDNAERGGVVIRRGISYVTVDITVTGKSVHPGKNITDGINVLDVFQDIHLITGVIDNNQTRINWGWIEMGTIRNAIPEKLVILGELRSFVPKEQLEQNINLMKQAVEQAAEKHKAKAEVVVTFKALAYEIDEDNALLQKYKTILKKKKKEVILAETYIASDANVFNERGIPTFVISTGVQDEHTNDENITISDMKDITQNLIELLAS